MADLPTHQEDGDTAVAVRPRRKLQKLPLYRVVLHNDDFTTMEFVVSLLETVFHHTEAEAMTIMLKVHYTGSGVAGIYPFEIAETKAAKAMAMARQAEYPLLCTVEPD